MVLIVIIRVQNGLLNLANEILPPLKKPKKQNKTKQKKLFCMYYTLAF